MHPAITLRQMNVNVFSDAPIPQVFFQPRFEPWFDWHRLFGTLPARFRDHDVRALYDELGASVRYIDYYTGMPSAVVRAFAPEVEVHEEFSDTAGIHTFVTPHGDLTERLKRTPDETWRVVEFAVKTPGDLKALRWLYQRTTYTFSAENFAQGSAYIGDRGEPQFYLPKSPYQALAQTWMKYADYIYALADYPDEIEATMAVIDDAYDRLYEEIIASGAVKIVNFGENLHAHLMSPRYFERHLIPFYEKRAGQLKRGGIYSHVHWDGYYGPFLKYLKHLPFDGLEALTPLPQGDVSLEETKEYIGDKVLLDGIPAVLFLPTYSREELMAMAEQVVKLFHPRLVLGVSDEVPEGAGEEVIERLRMVAAWCRSYQTG